MGKQIDELPHNTEKCHTKTGLKVFLDDDKVTGYCFSCKTFVPNPYGKEVLAKDVPKPLVKSDEEIQAQLDEVDTFPVVEVRKLGVKTLNYFQAKVSLSEYDGVTPTAIYWPLTRDGKRVGYHVKGLIKNDKNKSFVYNLGTGKDVDLIGWEQAKVSGAYRLIITEGPEDMASVEKIYRMHGNPEYHPAVVSLPAGAGCTAKVLQRHSADIKRLFKDVVVCFDDDEPGREAVTVAAGVLPNVESVTLPYKDANECLLQGVAKQAYKALAFQKAKPKNTRILRGGDIHEKAKIPAKYGELTWPFPQLNKDMRGIRLGETAYFGAGTKIGKTTLKNCLSAHWMKNDGVKVFMADIEEQADTTYKLLANQLTGKVFHDPTIPFDEAAYDKAGEVLKDKLYLLDLYQFVDWKTLKEDIKNAVGDGCKVVAIDPVTCLTNGVNAAEANTLLQEFSSDLAAMSKDMGFFGIMFCHLKAPDGMLSEEKRERYYGKGQYTDLGPIDHEWGGSVYSSQFTGSRAMQRSCHLMMGLQGNKDPDLAEEIRNTRQLTILEDRRWGNSGKYNLFYNKNTGLFEPC